MPLAGDGLMQHAAVSTDQLGALRLILNSLKNSEKELQRPLSDDEELQVLQRERKRRLEAAEAFRGGGREEQAASEERELAVLQEFMPEPLSEDELEEIGALIAASGAEPVLVLAAGGDARESAMLAEAFGPLGAGRLLLTRLDLARRLGSLLAAADAARLRFSSVSTAPGAAAALVPLNPVSLSRLLLPGPAAILPTSKTESVA